MIYVELVTAFYLCADIEKKIEPEILHTCITSISSWALPLISMCHLACVLMKIGPDIKNKIMKLSRALVVQIIILNLAVNIYQFCFDWAAESYTCITWKKTTQYL